MSRVHSRFSVGPRRLAVAIGVAAGFLIVGYSIFAALPFLEGPALSASVVATPAGTALIQGSTERVSYLALNGAPVPIDENGSFALERAYPPGYTVIVIAARDRFGRNIEKRFDFLAAPFSAASATST